jgi:hypothetical protein
MYGELPTPRPWLARARRLAAKAADWVVWVLVCRR